MNAVSGQVLAVEQLVTVLELQRRLRTVADAAELRFVLVNETHQLTPYRDAVLWSADDGVIALSGLVDVTANAPYVQWAHKLCSRRRDRAETSALSAADAPDDLSAEWSEWLPECAAWLPLTVRDGRVEMALLLARDLSWSERELLLLREWVDAWAFAYGQMTRDAAPSLAARLRRFFIGGGGRDKWWRRPVARWALAAVALCLFPVHLTVLAPGEIVPYRPSTLRAPADGVIEEVLVEPNQTVKAGQPLFRVDTTLAASRATAGREDLAAAASEYQSALQRALTDDAAKARLAELAGRLEQKREEARYLSEEVERGTVTAPQAGIVLFDDASALVGRPVQTGDPVMRVANAEQTEIEAMVGVADAIPLKPGSPVKLYLDASPLAPAAGKLRYFSHEAVELPNGKYAYRVRAQIDHQTRSLIGLKGTAKLQGGWSPLSYWVLRRPIAAARAYLGV